MQNINIFATSADGCSCSTVLDFDLKGKSHIDASACKALQCEMRIKKAPGSNHESLQRAAVWENWSHGGFSIRLIDLIWLIQHFSCWDTSHFLAVLIEHVVNAFDKLSFFPLMTCSVIGKNQKRPKKKVLTISMYGPLNQSSISSSDFICHLKPGTNVTLYRQTQFYFKRPAGPRRQPAYQQVGHLLQDSLVTISDNDISFF